MLRPDFSEPEQIHCYAMSIAWNVERQALVIKHKGISGSAYHQFGVIAFAKNEKFLSIDAGSEGWRQLAIVERMDSRRIMYGALFTLGNVARRVFSPTISPIVLIGYEGDDHETIRINNAHRRYDEFSEHLAQARLACVNVR